MKFISWYPLPSPSTIFYSSLILSGLNLNQGDRILDAGCGTGHLTYILAPKVAKSIGVDISQPTVDFISARLGAEELARRRLEYYCRDICDPAFGEQYGETFTKAFSVHVLEHVSNPAAYVHSLAQCIRPGGSMMVVFPNSRTHGRNFFERTTDVSDLFSHSGLTPMLHAMSATPLKEQTSKVYYALRNCYRMIRKESFLSSGDEFHQTRYYQTLGTTRFMRLALSIAIEALQPAMSRAILYRLKPLENATRMEEGEFCVLATKQQTTPRLANSRS
jgi:2-polyprenyl-3-methyl-5-hydroxy-6-metoxy-1,4-benzoquinol methylase